MRIKTWLILSFAFILFLSACRTAPRPAEQKESENTRRSSHVAAFCPEDLRAPKPTGGQAVDAYAREVEAWSKKVEELGCVPLE